MEVFCCAHETGDQSNLQKQAPPFDGAKFGGAFGSRDENVVLIVAVALAVWWAAHRAARPDSSGHTAPPIAIRVVPVVYKVGSTRRRHAAVMTPPEGGARCKVPDGGRGANLAPL